MKTTIDIEVCDHHWQQAECRGPKLVFFCVKCCELRSRQVYGMPIREAGEHLCLHSDIPLCGIPDGIYEASFDSKHQLVDLWYLGHEMNPDWWTKEIQKDQETR
jgi:hypothetical protein